MGAAPLYTKTYRERRSIEIDGFEMPVLIPDMPAKKDMVNFGLPLQKQKFYRTVVPEDLEEWDDKKKTAFVKAEWHKRENGVWLLVKGEPVYITGPAYVFFNYWVTEAGELPTFRMEAVEYFQVWDMALRDPKCLGILDIKCRRVGDTEKASFCGWELITRYRNSRFGMQNISENDAWENFQRIVMSNRAMVFFFKPKTFDSDMSQTKLEFKFSRVHGAAKTSVREQVAARKHEIKSWIDFKATKLKQYDGKRLRYYHLDEPGKIDPITMDINKQWAIIRLCITLNNGTKTVGKAAFTTTVEHFKDGQAVEILKTMWEQSDPNQKNDNGQTTTGLWRYFRGYTRAADVDEWGYHLVEQATEKRLNDIRDLERKRLFDDVTSYKRKLPANIHEALVPPEDDCILSPYLIDERINELERLNNSGAHWITRPVMGDLVWTQGFGSDVKWVPTTHGKWEISGHPVRKNHRVQRSGIWHPQSTMHFAAGADPIDHMAPKNNASLGGLAVAAIPDMLREDHDILKYDDEGNITNAEEMVTNRCVLTYCYRHENPYSYYEDVLKTIIYYGCKINIETQKPGLIAWMVEKGYVGYLASRPQLTDAKAMMGRNKTSNVGTPANTETIGAYVEAIKQHNIGYIKTHTHMGLLRDMRLFNGKKENRTKRDITVAWGYALTLANSIAMVTEKQKKKEHRRTAPFRYTTQN